MKVPLVLEIILFFRSVRSLAPQSERVEVLNSVRLFSGDKTPVFNVFGRIHCAMMCLLASTCFSANFDTTTYTCHVNSEITIEKATSILEENNWEIPRPSLREVWNLVFRATAGIGIAVYDAWIGSVSLPVATDSCKLTQSLSCLTHYRSSVLDQWTTNKIKQVRFSLYKNNDMVVNIMLKNMDEDNNTRWFSNDPLVNSSFPDMTPTSQYNHFSVFGHDVKVLRRFYISHYWFYCPENIGWITVFDDDGVCDFENGLQYPYFGYAPNNQKGNSLDFQSADVLAVFINQNGLTD